jgi:hypothetical protein
MRCSEAIVQKDSDEAEFDRMTALAAGGGGNHKTLPGAFPGPSRRDRVMCQTNRAAGRTRWLPLDAVTRRGHLAGPARPARRARRG